MARWDVNDDELRADVAAIVEQLITVRGKIDALATEITQAGVDFNAGLTQIETWITGLKTQYPALDFTPLDTAITRLQEARDRLVRQVPAVPPGS